MVTVCLEILNGGQSIEALNDTNVVLFQRRKEHAKCQIITRSVTINIKYRIVTKALANWLKRVLPSMISIE